MYNLPQFNFNFNDVRNRFGKIAESGIFRLAVLAIIAIVIAGFYADWSSLGLIRDYIQKKTGLIFQEAESENGLPQIISEKTSQKYVSNVSYEQAVIDAVKFASPSVVSIVISKNLPVYEERLANPFEDFPGLESPFNFLTPQFVEKGKELKEVGSGSGFIISEDGFVLTNKHVVLDKEAEYAVVTNEGKKYPAKVLAVNPVQDLAVIKIQGQDKFSAIKLGDSSDIQVGQSAIAIGNSLGEFRNTVSVGVVSGLGRTVSASGGGGFSETLEDIIQTDAAINPGNSGGPLLNLNGEVIGVNVAMAQGAQTIGFAIPINVAKKDINQVIKTNKINYPLLGVRYVLVDEKVKEKYGLRVDYGAIILKGQKGEAAITPGSGAEKAGLKEKDLILEFNEEKITAENSLAKLIQKYNPGDKITLKIIRDGKEIVVEVVLGER